MEPEAGADVQLRRSPRVLALAVWCWLASAVFSLAEGLDRVISLAGLAHAGLSEPATAGGLSRGQAEAALIAGTTVLAVLSLVFVVVPLRYAFALRQPGGRGRHARTLLSALAIAGVIGTVVGDVSSGVVPFASGSSVRDALGHTVDLGWLLAVVTATVAVYSAPARRFLRGRPLP